MTDARSPWTFILDCHMAAEPVALERLCQVVRVRGFCLARMSAQRAGDEWRVRLCVAGGGCAVQLCAQLAKLATVRRVRVVTQHAGDSGAGPRRPVPLGAAGC